MARSSARFSGRGRIRSLGRSCCGSGQSLLQPRSIALRSMFFGTGAAWCARVVNGPLSIVASVALRLPSGTRRSAARVTGCCRRRRSRTGPDRPRRASAFPRVSPAQGSSSARGRAETGSTVDRPTCAATADATLRKPRCGLPAILWMRTARSRARRNGNAKVTAETRKPPACGQAAFRSRRQAGVTGVGTGKAMRSPRVGSATGMSAARSHSGGRHRTGPPRPRSPRQRKTRARNVSMSQFAAPAPQAGEPQLNTTTTASPITATMIRA